MYMLFKYLYMYCIYIYDLVHDVFKWYKRTFVESFNCGEYKLCLAETYCKNNSNIFIHTYISLTQSVYHIFIIIVKIVHSFTR